jgi:GT2 family glycosyltransferase
VPEATVVIPCHTERRWDDLCAAVDSALRQRPAPVAVVVAVDANATLYQRLLAWDRPIEVVLNDHRRCASATRNAGARRATTPIVVFLDDDASARDGWLGALCEPFEDPAVVGTGGFVAPRWRVPAPRWFPSELAWVVGASFTGLPTERAEIRNVWSENMAARRSVFEQVGGFRVEFGKVGDVSRPEDTDLCIRMGKTSPEAKWIFVPDAVIDHSVGAERARLLFLLSRCYSEGRGKVELARHNDGRADLGEEGDYLRSTIPKGILRYLTTALRRGDLSEASRGAALCAGITAAGCGAAVAAVRDPRRLLSSLAQMVSSR